MPKVNGALTIFLHGETAAALTQNTRRSISRDVTANYYNFQLAPFAATAVSTSPSDSAVSAGARVIVVTGVVQLADGTKHLWQEQVTMAGTTPAPITINDTSLNVTGALWVDIFHAEVLLAGANLNAGVPVGTITVNNGATVLCSIQAFLHSSKTFRIVKPNGVSLRIDDITAGQLTNPTALLSMTSYVFNLLTKSFNTNIDFATGNAFTNKLGGVVNSSTIYRDKTGFTLPAQGNIAIDARCVANTNNVYPFITAKVTFNQ